ncbi:Myxococcales-restricted protein, TIGR02265 family [Myxococcus fulvus]|uniref:Myxococcales-restricted protein, TIGR02265 family n=1 Tax=Myxococcus fulvus TaxID=33 RepID=A0A511T781_MYXFU|nr:DUF2378 family protein [Myxococcus fulvus]GEN09837.1 hypothetical protein MFU01_48740 [Myxococcus fulvus]SEU26433.1 Myxococcales-restricted protein, TIGR02265 family [Myxococcus fulvus]
MPTEVKVQSTLFESLIRCMNPDSAQRAELLAAGYDVEKPRATYPASVFAACQAVALRTTYAGLAPKAAQRELGRDLVRKYFDTLVGRVVGMALKVAGPERAMKRVALSFSSVMEPVDITVENMGPQVWRAKFRGYVFPAEAAAGTCEVALKQAGASTATVEVERYEGTEGFDLRLRW